MKHWMIESVVAAVAVVFIGMGSARAADVVPKEEINPEDVHKELKAKPEEKGQGWSYGLSLGASGSWMRSSAVVGQEDGDTFVVGMLLDGNALYVSGGNEWQNTLKIEHGQTRTPTLDMFVKSADNLEFKSIYIFRIASVPWLGPYTRLKLNTALFKGYLVKAEPTTVVKKDGDGNVVETKTVEAKDELELTSPFEPMVMVESAGMFAEPFSEDAFKAVAKLGAAAQHVFASGGYAVTDDDETPELELTELQTSHSAGAELELELGGKLATNVTWGAIANFFYPIVTNSDTELTGMDLLHTDLGANVSFKLAKWLSVDYVLKAKRLPFVVDDWQIQNSMLVTAGFNLL